MKTFITFITLCYFFTNSLYSQSIEIDKRLGAESAKSVEAEMGIYDNEYLSNYISSIGQRLVSHLDNPLFEYQFYVVDSPIPNAFATPGGYIYITRGILSIMVSEDELACVMAHEIIHAQNRHSVKQIRNSAMPKLLELPGRIVGQVVHEDVGNLLTAPVATSNSLILASYSRSHEKESDREGITLASKAGYDPDAMKFILARLSEAVEMLTEQKEKKSYFNDHPYTPDRLKSISKTSAKLDWVSSDKISKDFPQPLNSLLFGVNPDKGFFEGNTFIHPILNFSFQFPEDWYTDNQPAYVNGMNEDQTAALFLGMDDASKLPKTLALEFIRSVERNNNVKPLFSDHYNVNNYSGYLVSYLDKSGRKEMYIHTLWVKMDNQMFKIIGIGPKSAKDKLKESVLSFHKLSDVEKNQITKTVIRIVKSKNGDTINTLCKRHEGIYKSELIALMNGQNIDATLPEGTLIKIVVEEKYL